MSRPFTKLNAAMVLSLCASFAMAQTTPANPAPKPMAPAAAPATKPAMSAKSVECSKLADTKGLHGKARKRFRSACKRGKTQG
jgi:psiF repeat